MGVFNDNLQALMQENQITSIHRIANDDANQCPDCCSLITSANNHYYSNMNVPREFMEKVLVHVVSQYIPGNDFFMPPLYLAIEGPAGEGKTSQTIATLTQHYVDVLYVSAAEISGTHEGESVDKMNAIYSYAVFRSERNCIAILIDDFHMGTVNNDSKIEKTINTNLLTGRMMNLADRSDGKKVPIIITGNDFSSVYAPLLRSGRADIYHWKPDMEIKKSIIRSIVGPFVHLEESEFISFCNMFREGTISDFSQLKNDFRKEYVWRLIQNAQSLRKDDIERLHADFKDVQRLNYHELCELAEKRIKPITLSSLLEEV